MLLGDYFLAFVVDLFLQLLDLVVEFVSMNLD